MAKIKLAYRGKVLKRSLFIGPTVIDREEYPSLEAKKMETVSYDMAKVILFGRITPIEKRVGDKIWVEALDR